jgi:hypothetical protein
MNNEIWSLLSKGEKHRSLSKFMDMKPEQFPSLSIAELSLPVQWVFKVRSIRTLKATV